jgi:hypothetical protein
LNNLNALKVLGKLGLNASRQQSFVKSMHV